MSHKTTETSRSVVYRPVHGSHLHVQIEENYESRQATVACLRKSKTRDDNADESEEIENVWSS